MNSSLQNSVNFIPNGFYKTAAGMFLIGLIAYFISRKFGGENKKRRKQLFELIWIIGILIFGIFVVPAFFKASSA